MIAEPPDAAFAYTDTHTWLHRVREGLPPMILCVAVNGGVQGRETSEAIPETPSAIAESVAEAQAAGAVMVHVHARDPERLWAGARRVDQWQEVIAAIRQAAPGLIINATTGGDLDMTMDERLAALDAGPDIASLNLTPDMSRVHFRAREAPLPHPTPARDFDGCIPFSYATLHAFAGAMQQRGIRPELELYHPGGHWAIRDLIAHGLVAPPYWVQTVMGYQTASYATPQGVLDLLRDLPEGALWLCAGIGPYQLPLNTLATLMGGHVRVGLEDNIYYARGRKFRSNAEAVARAIRIAEDLNRPVADCAMARSMLGLAAH
ncbi:MAG: 3-keto-5-aminohexanoate cleavage protein [Thermaurantiacus sp.]